MFRPIVASFILTKFVFFITQFPIFYGFILWHEIWMFSCCLIMVTSLLSYINQLSNCILFYYIVFCFTVYRLGGFFTSFSEFVNGKEKKRTENFSFCVHFSCY